MRVSLQLPPGSFDGYIFDCDGTLVDSMPAHYRAWKETLARLDVPFISAEEYGRMGGLPFKMLVDMLRQRHGTSIDPKAVSREKHAAYLASLPTLQPIETVVEFAREAARTHPVAVASTSSRETVKRTLAAIGIADLFPVIVGGDDVPKVKPAPDCYLLATQQLNVAPERCLAFEDSEAGWVAATRAGMKVVWVPSAHPAPDLSPAME